MFAKFFKAPTYSGGTWSTFSDDRLFVTDSISAVGSDWLWVQSIQYDGRKITISGKDCKGFLDTRISLYGDTQVSGAEGYDIVSGTTAYCIKHYLDNNCISPEDTSRKLPLEWSGGAYGLSNDHYMARLEYISDIVNKMCENAGIGYDVRGKLNSRCFAVATVQGTDRGTAQNVRARVIFSARHGNVTSQSFEHGVDDLYNEIYAEDVNGIVIPVSRGNEPVGISRRECTVNAGISSTDPATEGYFSSYVLNEVSDNVESHNYNIEPSVRGGYGTKYDIGDIVAIQNDHTKNLTNMQITEVTKSYSQGRQSLSMTFGKPKQKPLQKIVNDFLSGTARRK